VKGFIVGNTKLVGTNRQEVLSGKSAIKEKTDPVDTDKFFSQCSSPNLGSDQSLCGLSSIELNANLAPNNTRTYQWFKDGVSQGAPNKNNNTKTITQGGTWTVVVDSLGECSRTDEIIIAVSLPNIDLGEDVILCSPSNVDLDAGIAGDAINYAWEKDGSTISSETSQTLNVSSEGLYKLTISATGCPSKSDQVDVTTQLPETQGDVYCPSSNPNAQLLVLSSGGPFQWFENATGGSSIYEGDFFEVIAPTGTSNTYYVKDAGSFAGSVGPTTESGTKNDWGENGYAQGYFLEFEFEKTFDITQLSVPYGTIYTSHSGELAVEIFTTAGNSLGVFTSESKSLTAADAGMLKFTFTDFTINDSWGTTLRMAMNTQGTTIEGQVGWDQGGASFPYTSGEVAITGATANNVDSGSDYVFFYDWQIASGTDCERKPVTIELDCTVGTQDNEEIELATLFPNPAQNNATLRAHSNSGGLIKIFSIAGQLVDEQILEGQLTIGSNLSSGVYLVEILKDNQLQTIKFVKE